jgi:hypothetical protein
MFIITLRFSGLLPAAFLAVAMTTCLARFVMEITQVRKSCPEVVGAGTLAASAFSFAVLASFIPSVKPSPRHPCHPSVYQEG